MNKNFSILYICLCAITAQGQKTTGGTVQDQSQEVIKNFDARLIETEKVRTTPYLPAVDTSVRAQTYSVPNRSVNLDYLPPKLRPVAMKVEALPPQYDGYVKAGYGMPNSPYFDAAYRLTEPKKYNLNFKLKHHAADFKTIDNQRFATTGGDISGSFFAPKNGLAFDGQVGFKQDAQWYYGYNHAKDTFNSDASRQHFNLFNIGASVYNAAKTAADIDYRADVKFYNLSDFQGIHENEFALDLKATKWIQEKHPVGVALKGEFLTNDTVSNGKTQDFSTLRLQPFFIYHADQFKFKVGANLGYYKDDFYPMPDLEASVNLGSISAYAGWKGDFIRYTYRNLAAYNPYVIPRSKINVGQQLEYFGGVKGAFSFLDYQIQTGWSTYRNLALFLSDSTDKFKRFKTIYDTVGIFNVRATITARPIKDLEITGTLSQNAYSPNKEERAWGLPSLDWNIAAKYMLLPEKAFVKANLFVQNGVNYKNAAGQADRLGALFDLSVGAEYWFAKNIGAFVDANNLLNVKRERWFNYPTYGLNIYGGITARF
ncbi:MAG: hypothetical protein RL329_1642 [Bacteroidota bacterium]|jgi:hypothetical protein